VPQLPRTRILLADDHALIRAGLRLLIEAQADMVVVAEAGDGEETRRLVREHRPDVVLLDITMPRTDGMATLGEIARLRGGPRVVVVTMHDDPAYLEAAMAAGASGFLVKRAAGSELISAIRAVARGRTFVDASVAATGSLRGQAYRPGAETGSRARPLSTREAEVLRLLAQGYSNREVAHRLGISTKTVETFRARVSHKLGLQGRPALVRYAVITGVLTPESVAGLPDRPKRSRR